MVWTAAAAAGMRTGRRRPLDVGGAGRRSPACTARAASRPARDADLVVFAPDATFEVDPARLHHRHPVTPYAGGSCTGVVRDVWLRGDASVSDGADDATARDACCRRQPA